MSESTGKFNLYVGDDLKKEIKSYSLPDGITYSDVFKWLFKAALAEEKKVSDSDFRQELFNDPKGRAVWHWIRARMKEINRLK